MKKKKWKEKRHKRAMQQQQNTAKCIMHEQNTKKKHTK